MSLLSETTAIVSSSSTTVPTESLVLPANVNWPRNSGILKQRVGFATLGANKDIPFTDAFTGDIMTLPSSALLVNFYFTAEVPLVSDDGSNIRLQAALSQSSTNANNVFDFSSTFISQYNLGRKESYTNFSPYDLLFYYTQPLGPVSYVWLQNISNPFISLKSGTLNLIIQYI